ncbi:10829_t:CDS:2, partial [Gigaspora margarita]
MIAFFKWWCSLLNSDYVESLNDNYSDAESICSEISEVSNLEFTDFSFLLSQQHFLVCSETLRVFISLSLARYIISWYCVNDIYSLILNNMVHLICVENGLDLSASSFLWVVFRFSLKTFIEQEIIFLDLSSGPDHSPDIPEKPGYREWIASSDLNLSPIEVEILDFFKGYSSDDFDDSMVIESDEISCEYFNGQ